MSDIPTRTGESTASDHLLDHGKLHAFHNGIVRGPFTLTAAGLATGVTLYTPQIGEWIIGVTARFTEAFDAPGEQIGLGIAGTTDDDLAFKFPASTMMPPARPTFPRTQLFGIPWGGEVVGIATEEPLVAKSVLGTATTGALLLYVHTLPASLL